MKYMCMYPVEIGNSILNFEYAGVNDTGRLAEESEDHGLTVAAVTKDIVVSSKESDFNTQKEISGEMEVSVFITDSRIAFHCAKYDKGSTYWGIGGGAVVGLIMTGVSKSRAAKRTAGSVMVGHIRYEWLTSVACHKKTSWLDEDSLTLRYTDEDQFLWKVELNFSKGTDVERMANQIAGNVCRYKLAMTDEKTETERVLLSGYAQGNTISRVTVGGTAWEGPLPTDKMLKIALDLETEAFRAYPAPKGENFRPNTDELKKLVTKEIVDLPPQFCGECGFETGKLKLSARFCPKCGMSLRSEPVLDTDPGTRNS